MRIAVRGVVPAEARRTPLLLVHGSVTSAVIWRHWQRLLSDAGWASYALDLRGHGDSEPVDLGDVGMDDYLDDVMRVASTLNAPPVLLGWSMGGLISLRMAAVAETAGCIVLAPSLPARHRDPRAPIRRGVFDATEYGIDNFDPDRQRPMMDLEREDRVLALSALGLDSRRARDERQAGVVVDAVRSPLLLIAGGRDRQWGPEKYEDLWLPCERLIAPDASHWGLVLGRRALEFMRQPVLDWLDRLPASR